MLHLHHAHQHHCYIYLCLTTTFRHYCYYEPPQVHPIVVIRHDHRTKFCSVLWVCHLAYLSIFVYYIDRQSAVNIEGEASVVPEGGKYSEWSTAESSEDVEKQEVDEAS
ncbi:hypothetical protein L2E82_17413 [Cichorium intybus]|uniref:Uncharacterized protein n=1 Tax=Cichorium intybus TaxID=13427 RepID=A0ACB9F7J2_CICIN|nr:hypothetical protein L2E82_17413 [Cichorium intybus]